MNSIGIIGFGALGSSLAHRFHEQGILSWILKRDGKPVFEEKNIPIFSSLETIPVEDTIIILAVPDSEIPGLAKQFHVLHAHKGCHALIHCSGSLGRNVLQGSDTSIKQMCMHPFQSIASPLDLDQTPWGIDCDVADYPILEKVVLSLKGIPFLLSEHTIAHKSLYHATAVISSNLLQMLMALSVKMAQEAELPPELFLPRIQSTVMNRVHESLRESRSPLENLTGPLIRGDIETIVSNRNALRSINGLDEVYVALCKATLPLLIEQNRIGNQDLERLLAALTFDSSKR